MDKEVKKSSGIENFYFSVISAIRSGIYPSKIALQLGITKQQLNYYIKRLKLDGIIVKKGYATWEINEEKCQEFLTNKEVKKSSAVTHQRLHKIFTSSNEVRGHGFQFTLKIPKLKNWEKREEFLIKNNFNYKPIGSNWEGQRIILKGIKVWLTPVSIIIYAPKWKSYFADSSKHAKNHAIYEFLQLITKLENIFKVSFQINKKYKFKVSRQHYGLVKNLLAKQYDKEGKKLHCYAEDGFWLAIDNSYNLHELETLHPKTADDDNIKVQDFFNGLKRDPITSGQILETFNEIANIQKKEQEKWNFYAENIKSHTNAIKKLDEGIDKLFGHLSTTSQKHRNENNTLKVISSEMTRKKKPRKNKISIRIKNMMDGDILYIGKK